MSLAETHRSRRPLVVAGSALAALAVVLPTLAGAAPTAAPTRIPLESDWIGTRSGWEWVADGGTVRATRDGGRTWDQIFRGGNYLFAYARTSRNAGVASTGRISGAAYWTNDGGRRWFPLNVAPERMTIAGTGNQLYWHERGDTIYRVEGWPPRGGLQCEEAESDFGDPLPGHPLCRPVDDGLRSVVALRIAGSTFGSSGGMVAVPPARGLPGGVAELVDDLPHPLGGPAAGRGVVVVRGGGLALARLLPRPALQAGEEIGDRTLFEAWPRLYVSASLLTADAGARAIGTVLLRSRNGGDRWSVHVARALPRRAAHVAGRARFGARAVLPSGWVAPGRAGGRLVVGIRQLGRTRPLLALPGSARCGALRPVVDWPRIVVEGRRGTQLRAVWLSSDGGYRWTTFGRC